MKTNKNFKKALITLAFVGCVGFVGTLSTAAEQKPTETPFQTKLKESLGIAKAQLNDIETAKKLVDEAVKAKNDEGKTNKAQDALNKIKQPDIKKELQSKLDPIKKAVAEKKKADEEKRKAEEKAKAEAEGVAIAQDAEQAQAQADETGQPVYDNSTGGYKQPSRPSGNSGGGSSNSGNSGGSSSGGSGGGSTHKPSTPSKPSTPTTPEDKPTKYALYVGIKREEPKFYGVYNTEAEAKAVGDRLTADGGEYQIYPTVNY